MSTNSSIGVRNDDGGVEYIYCHWDGSIENNGRILMQYFDSKEAAHELVDLGNVSALDVEGHDGDETEVGKIVEINGCNVNVYTGKRAGKKRYAHSPLNMVMDRGTAEYVYVFDDNWWVACRETNWEFEELTSWVSESCRPRGRMLNEIRLSRTVFHDYKNTDEILDGLSKLHKIGKCNPRLAKENLLKLVDEYGDKNVIDEKGSRSRKREDKMAHGKLNSYCFEFDTPDEAEDQEFLFRDAWGHKYESDVYGDSVFVEADEEGAKIAEDFFGRKPVFKDRVMQ